MQPEFEWPGMKQRTMYKPEEMAKPGVCLRCFAACVAIPSEEEYAAERYGTLLYCRDKGTYIELQYSHGDRAYMSTYPIRWSDGKMWCPWRNQWE
jgi:hypothetical protein